MFSRYALLLAGVALSCAAASVSGVVSDAQGGVVRDAKVALYASTGESQFNTLTDRAGEYSIANVPPGNYLLQTRAPGFAEYRLEHLHVTEASDHNVNIALQIGTVQQEISVTAASTPQAVDQVSKALSLIDNSSIQQRQDYSLVDAIRLTPGIRVEQQGGPGSFSDIRIRGLRPQDTAVLIDGMRLRDASGTQADASGMVEDFLVTDASRIELLRGSGSSLYGTDAIGGVINAITDPGGGRTRGSLQLEGGTLGLFRGAASAAGGSKNDRLQFSGGITHLNVTEGVDGYDAARTSTAQGRIAYRLNSTTQLVARFMGADSFSMLNSDPSGVIDNTAGLVSAIPLTGAAYRQYSLGALLSSLPLGDASYIPGVNDPDSRRGGRFDTGALSLLGQPLSALGYAVDYQIVDSGRHYNNGPGGIGFQPFGNTRSDYNGRIQTVNARMNLQAGRYNLLTGGYEFENEHFSSGSVTQGDASSDSFVGATQTSHAAFGQDQIRLFGDRLYISLGFRAQYFALEDPTFTPAANAPFTGLHLASPPAAYTGDASAAYFLRRTGTKIRAHVGRGYRAPALFERFGAGYDSFFGYTVYGNPNLEPERAISVDAGIDQSLLNNRLRISATYFYTHLQRVIAFDFSGMINPVEDPFGRFEGYLNTSGGFARGIETSADWAATRSLTVAGSYTYTDARERTPLVPGVFRTFITPEHQFTAFAVQRFGKRIYVDCAMNASSSYLTEMFNQDFTGGAYRFPGSKRADIGASYRVPLSENVALRVFAKGQNIFNQTYYESGFRTEGVGARGGLQLEF